LNIHFIAPLPNCLTSAKSHTLRAGQNGLVILIYLLVNELIIFKNS